MHELKHSFVSLTAAQSAVRLLGRNGIRAVIRRTDGVNGCRYAILTDGRSPEKAEAILAAGSSGAGKPG